VLCHRNFWATQQQVKMGSCSTFRKMCLCMYPSPGPTGQGQFTVTCHPWRLRCSLPCCGSEGVPAHGTISSLTACHLESYWSSDCSLPSDVVPGAVGRGQILPPPYEKFGQTWPLQRCRVLTCACLWIQHCVFKPFSSSGYLQRCVHEMVRAAGPSAPAASALSAVFLTRVLPVRCAGLFMVPT